MYTSHCCAKGSGTGSSGAAKVVAAAVVEAKCFVVVSNTARCCYKEFDEA